MSTSISIHAWQGRDLTAQAQMGAYGACVLELRADATELALYLPAARYAIAVRVAALLAPQFGEQPDTKPFNTYPEDREELLALCQRVEAGRAEGTLEAAYRLADLVKAILEDEAVAPKEEAA